MTLLQLSWKNGGRRPLRTTVTLSGIAVAVAALFSLISFERGYQRGVRHELDQLGAHILVAPKGCPYDAASMALHGANWPCFLKSSYLDEVRAVSQIAAAAPVLMNAVDFAGQKSVFLGIDESWRKLKRGTQLEGRLAEARNEIDAGAEIARENNWRNGDFISLPALGNRRVKLVGIFQPTHAADDFFMYFPLAEAQRIFEHPGQITHILVQLKDPNHLQAAVAALRGCDAGMDMTVIPLTHLFRSIQAIVNSTKWVLSAIAAIALLIAAAGISNTVMMSVAERTREIGVMRALGASRAMIFKLFWLETLLMGMGGAAGGIASALVASHALENWIRTRLPFAPTENLIQWEWNVAALCGVGVFIVSGVAGLLPAWRAACLAPVEAIREPEFCLE